MQKRKSYSDSYKSKLGSKKAPIDPITAQSESADAFSDAESEALRWNIIIDRITDLSECFDARKQACNYVYVSCKESMPRGNSKAA